MRPNKAMEPTDQGGVLSRLLLGFAKSFSEVEAIAMYGRCEHNHSTAAAYRRPLGRQHRIGGGRMRRSWAYWALPLGIAVVLTGCDLGDPSTGSDPQRVKVFFKFDFRDQVDTFNGTLTKDLVLNGTVTVPFGFKRSEQDTLVTVLAHTDFFGLPDTLYPIPNVSISPDPGFQVLRGGV